MIQFILHSLFTLNAAYSFIDLIQYLFGKENAEVFFSRRICQDPLEKFFGCQRQVNNTHDNVNVKEFGQNMQTLRIVNVGRDIAKTNVRGNKDLHHMNPITDLPLAKRRKG